MLKRNDRCGEAGEEEYSVIHKVVVCVLKFPLAWTTRDRCQEKYYLALNRRELLSISNKLITFAELNEV